jgi:Asp/Glu/hydantoin racemase
MSKVRGGKSIYGAAIGILMLESRFPRIPGDGGHAATWPFPLLYKVIRDATPERVVRQGAEGLLDAFIEGARELIRMGADGITTNCGFLALYQAELAAACQVPVAASSLMQVPWVQSLLPPGKRVGIVTVSASTLTPLHLERAGARPDSPVVGTESGQEFSRVLLGDELELDVARARRDVLDAGERLVREHGNIGAVVLECTNMIPYAADMSDRLGLPVYDFYSFVTWFHAGLRPRRFG